MNTTFTTQNSSLLGKLSGALLKSILFFAAIICAMTVNAKNVKTPRIYYDNSTTSYGNVSFVVGHNTYSRCYKLSKISNTDLWYRYLSGTGNDSWNDATQIAVFGVNWDTSEGSNIAHRRQYTGSGTDKPDTWKYTNTLTLASDLNSGKVYLVTAAGNKSTTSIALQSGGYTDLNYTQTVQQQLTTDGTTYNAATEAIATVTVTSYQLSNYSTTASNYGTIASGSSSATCIAARTATVTYTVSDVKEGYTFVGWYDGETQKLTNTTYTYNATAAKTITARFKKDATKTHTVTVQSSDINKGTITPNEPTQMSESSGGSIAATANSGYHFTGWSIVSGSGSFTNANAASTTFTPTAASIVQANFEANTYTITWDLNDGSETTMTSEYTYNGDPVNLPEDPTRSGYTFNGWWTAKTDGEKINDVGNDNKPTSNVTYYAQWNEITYTINISTDGNGTVSPNGNQQIGIVGLEVTATPNDPSRFRFTKWEVSGGALVADNYGATTTVTATADGEVIAHFEELRPKTIYLKTVEGTDDGDNWYIKYNGTEVVMTELGCTGEYYRGVVPEGTSFQFVSRDASTNIVETKGTDLQYVEGKTLYNLVSLAAGGNKIFFNPNTNWLSTNWNNDNNQSYEGQTPRFAALFDGKTWLDMTDNNDDKIFECVKPSGATKVYFCRMKPNTTANSWNEKWQQTDEQTIPNGKNLFTLPADVSLSDWARGGTWSEIADNPVNGEGEWTIFEGATYRITFNHEGATDGTTTPGVAYVDAQHNSAMPTIESLPKNTDWKFAGYYTAANSGTPITNAFGDWLDADGYISNGKWIKEECVTLYAHWVEKTPEITNVALSKNVFDVGSEETVIATPTVVEHSYKDTYFICWKLLDNSGTVMDLFPFTPVDPRENNSVSFSVDGLTSGTYTVRASIYASACDTGEELSRFDAKITIVSGYKVTVKYLCGDNVIKASDIYPGHASTPTPITAPEIGGYKFVNWELGDGIFSESDLKSENIEYTAIYDGYLTAKYEKRKLIFLDLSTLKTKANWTAPHIYLYKGAKDDKDGGYWNDQTGAGGGTGGNYITHAAMTPVPNTENIWYFDYEQYTNNFNVFVAFTSNNQGNATHFANCEAIYRTEFSSGTPVFVPESDQTAETKNSTAKYYSKGYWVKYMDGTGYWMIIYNAEGNKELVRREFTSETQRMTMTSIVDLEAEHTYKYEIYRNDGYYYNGGDITYTNSSNYKPLNEANKHSIKTIETGNYTFTLDYFTGDLQIKVQYPGEVGDYRILYKDNTRTTYKPSDIKKAEELNPVTSFFIRPNSNPELKIQTAAHITDGGVTWYTADNHIYFKPNDLWKSDNARFAAYFYNGSKNEWKELTKNGDIYSCEKPSGYTHVIFVRLNPAGKGNSQKNNGLHWDYKWTQTIDLSLPKDGKNFYSLEEGAWRGQIYLKPNSNWTQGNARFAAYFFEKFGENTTKEEWHSMFKEDDGTYWCGIPDGCSNVVFCRMNPAHSDNRWNTNEDTDDTKRVWNQTTDLTVPTDGKLLYTVEAGTWDKGGGTWSVGEGTWNKITGSITNLTEELKKKLGEINGDIGKAPDAVYTIHLEQNDGEFSIAKVVPYTGNFYIRVDAAAGKWYDYKTNPDNLMTYSAFSESNENSFGEKFSHYKTKWCEQGMNVKFVIANDYSLCISDTLAQDVGNPFGNIDEHGNINSDGKYNANIRFMWNRHTNKVSRAYVAAASDDKRKFLVLKANKTIQNESGNAINNNEVVFNDTQNWLYERTIKVQPGTLVKLYACYPDLDEANAQHFRGKYSNDFTKDSTAVQILGGTSSEWYTMRIVYDFKTNRLMGAWVPDQNINGKLEIDADIMVIRQHQEDATYITFADEGDTLTAVKTVYGVIRFNRWTLNNRSTADHNVLPVQNQKTIYERALYFISFPFDVHLSDVFGFGTYGMHWVISTYNGLRRAQRGYFAQNCFNDDCTNWDYIWDPDDFVLEANKGYLLSLDLDLMKHDNEAFWAHDIQQVELFFPSYANVETIAQTNYTMPALSKEYECKINYSTGNNDSDRDRTVKDSYWRCIGVPSFADYNSTLTTDGDTAITWQPKDRDFPFLYEWNVSDNSLMVRAAKTYRFRPTFAYLVQNGNEIHWSAVNATPPPASIAARQRTEAERNYDWKITLSNNDVAEDQTYLRMTDNEEVSEDFDFNQDLAKELNYGRSDIYTFIGYEKAAANSMPFSENTTVISLGLDIEQAGDYTIAMPEGVESVGVTLLDVETGTRTNLSTGMNYTVALNKGVCHNRLYLEISPVQNDAPTDIEYTDQSAREESIRKVLIDGKLYIVCDGVVYDAQGHRL